MRNTMPVALALISLFAANLHAGEAIHERIEWSDVWIVDADTKDLPRVLMVGDSIVRGYYAGVEKLLGDKASCARFTTSKFLGHPDFLEELGLILKRFSFDVIHVNNGLHGWGYSEEQYREGLNMLLEMLQREAPDAKIVWCMSTPMRDSKNLAEFDVEKNDRVKARNAIAAEAVAKAGIPVNDLYTLVADKPAYFSKDGVHYSDDGRAVQAKQVASYIESHLPK